MTNTPLNPDALKKGYDAARSHEPSYRARLITVEELAERITRAYLAVAQPEVNSVEELESYPLGTVFLDDLDDVMQHLPDGEGDSYWVRQGDFRCYDVTEVELPARVLYRPEVTP